MRPRKSLLALAAAIAASACPSSLPSTPAPHRAPHRAPVVVLVSLDAFRWDYLQRPAAVNLRALAARGVHAERLVPSFPSKTFPNHYTLVTGLYPEHHGIVANVMADSALGRFATGADPAVRDGRWFGGEPIWVTAEKQHVRTAPDFWPGSEAKIDGVRPTWYTPFDATTSRADRVRRALARLAMPADRAPRLVTLYLNDVDDASHAVGPFGARTDSAIAQVDSAVGALVDGIDRLHLTDVVDLVVVSDHGMAPVAPERTIFLDDYVAMDSLEVIDWTPVAAIAPRPGREAYVYARLSTANPHLAIYRKRDVPARLHFDSNPRITPIVGIAEEGWSISTHERASHAGSAGAGGAHGYDNQLASMGALFVAAGPAFRRGVTVPPFQNIHVYPVLAKLLGVTPARTDGSLDSVRTLFRR
ncbi:MAG: alkaline phosphatase family protein [Proteobacteria bacterium]|nr:alkaline phosphatase family protein [Pseudomonadota bacterium]